MIEQVRNELTRDKDKIDQLWADLELHGVEEEDRITFFEEPHPDLQNRTPLQAINEGDYRLVQGVLERMSSD